MVSTSSEEGGVVSPASTSVMSRPSSPSLTTPAPSASPTPRETRKRAGRPGWTASGPGWATPVSRVVQPRPPAREQTPSRPRSGLAPGSLQYRFLSETSQLGGSARRPADLLMVSRASGPGRSSPAERRELAR